MWTTQSIESHTRHSSRFTSELSADFAHKQNSLCLVLFFVSMRGTGKTSSRQSISVSSDASLLFFHGRCSEGRMQIEGARGGTLTQVDGLLQHLLEEGGLLLPAASLHLAPVGLRQELQRLQNKFNGGIYFKLLSNWWFIFHFQQFLLVCVSKRNTLVNCCTSVASPVLSLWFADSSLIDSLLEFFFFIQKPKKKGEKPKMCRSAIYFDSLNNYRQ